MQVAIGGHAGNGAPTSAGTILNPFTGDGSSTPPPPSSSGRRLISNNANKCLEVPTPGTSYGTPVRHRG